MLWNPSATQESLLQQLENIAALFPDGVHKAANADETLCAFKRASTPRDLLEKAYHTERPFRQIVREGNFRLLDEKKHFVLVLAEAIMKVGRLGLLPTAPRAFLSRFRRRELGLASSKNRTVALSEKISVRSGKDSVRSGVLDPVHLRKQIEHLLRPPLSFVLEGRPKLAKKMRTAQSMRACVQGVEVGLPAVVDENARVFQKNAEIVDSLLAAPFEDAQKRCSLGGRDVSPVERSRHPQSGFVNVQHSGFDEKTPNGLLERLEVRVEKFFPQFPRSLGERHTEERAAELRKTLVRNELDEAEIECERQKGRPVLYGDGFYLSRKRSFDLPSALRTAFADDLMLGHDDPWIPGYS